MQIDTTNWKKTATDGFFFAGGAAIGWKAVGLVLTWVGMGIAALAGTH